MSHKSRLSKLEKIASTNKLWVLIGIGKANDAQHLRQLEIQARDAFHTSGGDSGAYLAFMPFDCFNLGFISYIKKGELMSMVINRSKNPAESWRDSQPDGAPF